MNLVLGLMIFLNSIYAISITGIVFADNTGTAIEVFYEKDKGDDNESHYDNSIWFESNDDGNYVMMYDFSEEIAGLQFTFVETNLDYKLHDRNFINGEIKKNNFTLKYDQASKTFIAFSFEGKTIPAGLGELFEISEINNDEISEASIKNESINSNDLSLQNTENIDIDIVDIIFSGKRGQQLNVILECHKEECEDYKKLNSNGSERNGKVFVEIIPIGENKWRMLYDSEAPIAGFQFCVNGAKFHNASGGEAEKNGFQTTFGGNTILSFSFTGEVIPKGSGNLVDFSVEK